MSKDIDICKIKMASGVMSLLRMIFFSLSCMTIASCRFADKSAEKPLVRASLADMIFVKGGSYMMGPSLAKLQVGNMVPVHKVILSSFYISKYNVDYKKYDLYAKVMGIDDVDSKYKKAFFRSLDHPVDLLSWQQANSYCEWLGNKTGLPYALPTEAQWEYVARNGGKKNWLYPTDDGTLEIGKNFPSFSQLSNQKNSFGMPNPLPVGSIPCTPMHICGLTGEVNQWMYDWYSGDYYSNSKVDNPEGPKTGFLKVVRGVLAGSSEYSHSYGRAGGNPKSHWAGLRCVINTDMPQARFSTIIKKYAQ